MEEQLHDPRFPSIGYRIGASGWPQPVVRGTGVRVQALAVAAHHWQMPPREIAEDYDLLLEQVESALAFYDAHRAEIDTALAAEQRAELELL